MFVCVAVNAAKHSLWVPTRSERHWERHTLPHVERCEVNDVLCNNGGISASFVLPKLQDLTASTRNASDLHSISQHWHDLIPKNNNLQANMCVYIQPCACSIYQGRYRTREECSRGQRNMRLLTNHVYEKKKKIEASEKLWKHALLKPENTVIGAFKVFDTERPYDCVGGWAEQHCVSRQGRDILTAGMLSIVNYQDFCTDSFSSSALPKVLWVHFTYLCHLALHPHTPLNNPLHGGTPQTGCATQCWEQLFSVLYCQLLIFSSRAGVSIGHAGWFVKFGAECNADRVSFYKQTEWKWNSCDNTPVIHESFLLFFFKLMSFGLQKVFFIYQF